MNAFTTTDLSVRYHRNTALADCTLNVPIGRLVALVGVNGAGKTTLLNCLTGLVVPTSGRATVLGGLPAGSSEARNRVAFVAQDAPLYRNLTVAAMLTLTENLNRTFDRFLAHQRLTDLDLLQGRAIGNLSLGQQAQVSLTLALARHPELLILDEPLARLDPIARRDFMRLVLSAAIDDGVSVLFSSHVIAELEPVADYLILLRGGRVLVAEEIETFVAGHCVLTGPLHLLDSLKEKMVVLETHKAGRQVQVLVRRQSRSERLFEGWECEDVLLEELILAHLGGDETVVEPNGRLGNIVELATCRR